MRGASVLLVLAACAPAPAPVRLVLDVPNARTLVVFQSIGGHDVDPIVVDLGLGDGVPALTTDPDEPVETAVVVYDAPPEALGLVAGVLPAARSGPRIALPRPRVVRTAVYGGGDTETVHLDAPLDEPRRIAAFRHAVPCPSGPEPDGSVTLIEGCPLPFVSRERACWGPLTPLAGLEHPGDTDVGSIVDEGGRSWMYLTSDRFGADSFTRHIRARLVDPRTIDATSIAPLPTLPPLSRSSAGWQVRGWADPPWVRRDGLEMWFGSSYPDQIWQDQDGYVSARTALDAPWPLGTNALSVGSAFTEGDGMATPVLLLDDRTLLWETRGNIVVGWRSETRAGFDDFVTLGTVVDGSGEPVSGLQHLAPSCDGGHLFYDIGGRPYIARILAMPTADDGQPSGALVVEPRPLSELPTPPYVRSLSEALDCQAMYVSDHHTVFVSERVACPD